MNETRQEKKIVEKWKPIIDNLGVDSEDHRVRFSFG